MIRFLALGLLLAIRPSLAATNALDDLIRQLGAQEFAARQAAQEQLLQRGTNDHVAVLAACVPAFVATTDPEVKIRLREVMAALVEAHIRNRPRGYLGVRFANPPVAALPQDGPAADAPPAAGILIQAVIEDSPAARAGLQAGDRILKMNDLELGENPDTQAFIRFIQSQAPGAPVTIVLQRAAETLTIPLDLGALPEELRAQLAPLTKDPAAFFHDWLREQIGPATTTPPVDRRPAPRHR